MQRPVGITIVAVVALISALFGLCWPTLVLSGSAFLGPVFGTVGFVAGIFMIIGPLLQLIFAIGALNLKTWAWYIGLISTGITVLGVVINMLGGGGVVPAIGSSLVSIAIFIYLLTPSVRQAFHVTKS